jgi:hypothetical protein
MYRAQVSPTTGLRTNLSSEAVSNGAALAEPLAVEKQLKLLSKQRLEDVRKTLPNDRQAIKQMCETQAHEGFMLLESNEKLKTLTQSLAHRLTADLAPHFSRLVNSYNNFFSRFAANLGVWNSVVEGNLLSLPASLINPAEFSELCKINGDVLRDQYTPMRPLMNEVQEATAVLCSEISLMHGKINSHDQLAKTQNLESSAKEIQVLEQRIRGLKKRLHNAAVSKHFMKSNKNNTSRVQEFYAHRMEHLQHQLYQVEAWITENLQQNRSETTTCSSQSGKWIFTSCKTQSETTKVERDISALIVHKESLLAQVEEARKSMSGAADNFFTTCQNLETDANGLKEEIEEATKSLQELRQQHDKSSVQYLTSALTVCMNPEDSAAFGDMIIALKFLLTTISYEVSKMDTTTQRIQAVFNNNKLSAACVIQSIYNMFTFPVKFSIMNTGSYGLALDPMFEASYLKFTTNNEQTFKIAMQKAPVKVIQQKEDEMAEDIFERGAAELYGF